VSVDAFRREARAIMVALSRDDGRPTATSLLFIADRLMEREDDKAILGRTIRNEVASRTVPAARIGARPLSRLSS
jgi:hypothetical protein